MMHPRRGAAPLSVPFPAARFVPSPLSSRRDALRFLVYVLYCLEGGVFLTLAPWSALWKSNYFFQLLPLLGTIGLHPVARGLVSAVGVLLFLHGIAVVFRALHSWLRAGTAREDLP